MSGFVSAGIDDHWRRCLPSSVRLKPPSLCTSCRTDNSKWFTEGGGAKELSIMEDEVINIFFEDVQYM